MSDKWDPSKCSTVSWNRWPTMDDIYAKAPADYMVQSSALPVPVWYKHPSVRSIHEISSSLDLPRRTAWLMAPSQLGTAARSSLSWYGSTRRVGYRWCRDRVSNTHCTVQEVNEFWFRTSSFSRDWGVKQLLVSIFGNRHAAAAAAAAACLGCLSLTWAFRNQPACLHTCCDLGGCLEAWWISSAQSEAYNYIHVR
jgi:hypothetical protein